MKDLTDLNSYSTQDLLVTIEAELAKSLNELRCLQGDADKLQARLKFNLALIHILKSRKD